jgi:hypothetical protein
MRKPLLILLLSLALFSCSVSHNYDKQKAAEQHISKVENFSRANGRLPDSLRELGVPESEEGPIYYRRLTDSTYEIWFGTGLGESVTYNSDTATWR